MTRQFTVTTLLLVVFSTACAASASATPAWGNGESIVRLLTLPPKPAAADLYGLTGKHLAVGYKYSYFGVMGVELWTWGGTYCLFEGNKYFTIPEAEANRLSEARVGVPFFYRHPVGLLVIGFVLVLGVPTAILRRRMLDKASPPQSILSM
jgi:hypothetical protein